MANGQENFDIPIQTRPRRNAVFINEFTDVEASKRAAELVNDVYEHVMKKTPGFKHRIVHGARTFCHTDVKNNARSQVGHVVGIGFAVAAAASVAAIPVTGGISFIGPALVGLGAWGAKKGLAECMHSYMKRQIKLAIRGEHWPTSPIDNKTTSLSMDMVNALIYDMTALKKNYQAYKKDKKEKALSFKELRDDAIANFSSLSKERANVRYKIGPWKTDPYKKVRIRIARLLYYSNWLLAYLTLHEEETRKKVEEAAREMEALFDQVIRQVHYAGNHIKCEKTHICYGPAFNSLRKRSIPAAQHQTDIDAAMRIFQNPAAINRLQQKEELILPDVAEEMIEAGLKVDDSLKEKAITKLGEGTELAADFYGFVAGFRGSQFLAIQTDSPEAGTAEADSIALLLEATGAAKSIYEGKYSEAALIASMSMVREGASMGATRAGGALTKLLGEGVGAGMAGNAVTALINETIGIAISKTKESVTVNRPVLKSVHKMLGQTVAGKPPDIDEEFAHLKTKDDPGVMNRLMQKISFHYPHLIGNYAKQLHTYSEKINQRVQNREPTFVSCREACEVVKRMMKVHRYAEKLELHIALLRMAILYIRNDIYLHDVNKNIGNNAVSNAIGNEQL